jgi:Tfp pilus assembly protein PilF
VTLVQVLANETSLHIACDFCLTNPYTGEVVRNDAFKLISVARPSVSAFIGVTGVGVLEGKLIGQWIAEAVGWLDGSGSIDDIVDVLASKAETPLSRIADAVHRRHSFVVGAMIGTQARISLVSNFEAFVMGQIQRTPTASIMLTVTSIKPKSPQLFVTGAANLVTASEREQLELMLKSNSAETAIQEQLSQVNAEVSRRTHTVSAGCYVASLHATGRGSARPFLTEEQTGDFIPPEFQEMFRRAGLQLKPEIGPDGRPLPIRMEGSTSMTGGASPEYFREQFKLQPDSAELWNNYGSFLAGKRKFDEAMDAFEHAMALDASYVTAIANLAKQRWMHRGDRAESDRLYAHAIRTAEPSVPSWILSDYGVFCDEGLADSDRARDLHNRAAEDVEYPLGKARFALFLLKNGEDSERADSLLTEALVKQPENPDILFLCGQADWFYKGDREGARAKLQKACTLNPPGPEIWRLTGDVSLVLGDGASAAYYYRKAIKRGASGWLIHCNYGLALLVDRKPDGSLRQLTKARRYAPNQPDVLTNMAASLSALRRDTEAASLMRQVLSQPPPLEIEVEVLAMLRLTAPPAVQEMVRLRELIASGVHGDGNTLRSMVFRSPRQDRDLAFQLADIVEGKAPLPPTL